MQEIIQRIIDGDLTRDIDESYAGGLWDQAGLIASSIITQAGAEIGSSQTDILQEAIQEHVYNALWDMAEAII